MIDLSRTNSAHIRAERAASIRRIALITAVMIAGLVMGHVATKALASEAHRAATCGGVRA